MQQANTRIILIASLTLGKEDMPFCIVLVPRIMDKRNLGEQHGDVIRILLALFSFCPLRLRIVLEWTACSTFGGGKNGKNGWSYQGQAID
jgi:hypothetical protein